jgi:hypothetical protein
VSGFGKMESSVNTLDGCGGLAQKKFDSEPCKRAYLPWIILSCYSYAANSGPC